jgi:hypothetical protein
LAVLSKVQGRPQNQLVNEAVRALVSTRARDMEVDPKFTLARLKAHRLRDPTGDQSMAAAMEAEPTVEDGSTSEIPGDRDDAPGHACEGDAPIVTSRSRAQRGRRPPRATQAARRHHLRHVV